MADNPLNYGELLKNDGAIQSLIDDLLALDKTHETMAKNISARSVDVSASIAKVSGATTAQREALEEAAIETTKLVKAQNNLDKASTDNTKQLTRLKLELQEKNRVTKLEAKLNKTAADSYNGLSAQYALNKIRLNDMSKSQRESSEEGQKLVSETKALREEMNRLQKETGNTSLEVGNYKENVTEALKEQEFFGLSLKSISSLFTTTTGLISAGVGVVAALGKAYISSARGAEDLARASDRLDSIMGQLGNTIANVVNSDGGSGILDSFLGNVQQQFLGLGSFVKSQVSVALKSSLRSLEIHEAEQERFKKAELQRAEELRQVRDEERNSIEVRTKANIELADVIANRESKSVEFQERKLAIYKLLLKQDQQNLVYQELIKRTEFEIADIREEAAGYVSEQLINDLALSREVNSDKLALEQARIQEQLIGLDGYTEKRIALEMELIGITKKLQLQAAGENSDRIALAVQTATNAQKTLLENVKVYNEQEQALKEKALAQEKKRLEALEKARLKALEDEAKKAEALRAQTIKDETTKLNQIKNLADSEIELMDKTEKEKTALRLGAEKARLRAIIDLNTKLGGELSNLQVAQMENTILAIDNKIAALETDDNRSDIYSALGLKVTEETKQSIANSVGLILDSLNQIASARAEATDRAVDKSNFELEQAQRAYDTELDLQRRGEANSFASASRRLIEVKRNNDKALKEQEKAQKALERIQTAQQVSSLVTATSQILQAYSGLPFIGQALSIAAIATMFGAFAESKISARKAILGDGGEFDITSGGSHASGNDTSLGVHGGIERRVERGEKAAVFSKKAVRKHGSELSSIIKSINNGTFNAKYNPSFLTDETIQTQKDTGIQELITENALLRKELKQIVLGLPQTSVVIKDGRITKSVRVGNTTYEDMLNDIDY